VTRSQTRRLKSAVKTDAPEPPERRTHLLWREPDDTAETMRAQIRQMIADASVEVLPLPAPGAPWASFRASAPNCFVPSSESSGVCSSAPSPCLLWFPGATDMAQLLARDVEAYGFGSIVDDA